MNEDAWAKAENMLKLHVERQAAMNLVKAEEMGYDAGRNGPNTTNCHPSVFSRPEFTKAWELGKKRGDAERTEPQKDER